MMTQASICSGFGRTKVAVVRRWRSDGENLGGRALVRWLTVTPDFPKKTKC
jgi:hypothetical protein